MTTQPPKQPPEQPDEQASDPRTDAAPGTEADAAPDNAPAADPDQTVFAGATVPPTSPPQDEGDDRTVFTQAPAAPLPDSDATVFTAAPGSVPPTANPDATPDEATVFGGTAHPAAAPPAQEGDATVFSGAAAPTTQTPAAPPPTQAPPAPTPMPGVTGRTGVATVEIGTLINNNYEVKEVLKAGGMGEVYRGENVITRKPVAIKVVLPELAEDEKVGLMFLREATTLSELSDEAIVGYQNFIQDPVTGRYCLIMDFISGVPLSEFTKKNGAITKEAGRTLLKRLAKGLEKAHARDVIHRDLSPDNVMLPDGIIAEALLIDFGIAKSNVVKEGTMAGQFAGKFKYVSPEQLGHFGGEIGPATDIYGLALLMAAALKGSPLDMGSSIVEAVEARRAIPDLSDMPEDLAPLLAHMLEPDPANRPADMAAVGRLLDHPEEIPAQYNGGVTMAPLPGATTTRAGLSQPAFTVSGLQTPPTANTSRTAAPLTQPGQSLPGQAPAREKRGGGVMALLAVVFLAAMGGAGYYAWSQGMMDDLIAQDDGGDDDDTAPPDQPSELPQIMPHTRDGFLAGFDTGPCTYAARVAAGANAGMVLGFASRGGLFAGLPTAYEERFGAHPTVLDRIVTPEQCAALEFARSLQGRGIDPVQIRIDYDEVASGAPISGQIIDPLGRKVWLVLVSPKGGVYNLTDRLSDPVGDRRSFRFAMSLAPNADPAPQLLLAVATGNPLVNAASARDGSDAQMLMPIIAREITDGGGKGVAALSHVLLTQPAPEPASETSPEPETDPDTAPTEGEQTDPDTQ